MAAQVEGIPPRIQRTVRWLSIALVLATVSCAERRSSTVDERLCSDLAVLRGERIFFGHQSVGRDILSGANELCSRAGCPGLRIVAASGAPAEGGFIAETAIGRNGEPVSKCEDFSRELEKFGDSLDLALMKFCYVDFSPDTRVEDVLREYERTAQQIQARHPRLTIVHVTAPLMSPPAGIKPILKRLLGRADETEAANLKRQQFNAALRSRHAGEPFFDLAAAESTYPDGRRREFRLNGATAYSMVAAYTSDGGHLNTAGRQAVAREFLRALAEAASHRSR